MDEDLILYTKNLAVSFEDGREELELFSEVNIEVYKGDLISITGKSGSGKSTLLYILSGLESFYKGEIFVKYKAEFVKLSRKSHKEREDIKRQLFSFVFQESFLIPELSVLDNILLALDSLEDKKRREDLALKLDKLLKSVEIEGILKKKASVISSGERLRVALIRAICPGKSIVFLDEPTGALDNINAKKIEELILNLQSSLDMSFIFATHDESFAARAKKRFRIEGKKLVQI